MQTLGDQAHLHAMRFMHHMDENEALEGEICVLHKYYNLLQKLNLTKHKVKLQLVRIKLNK